MKKEILNTPSFLVFARTNLILVELDYQNSGVLPPALEQQNALLSKKYRVRGYPTILLLTPKGKVIASYGYQRGGPEPFIAKLKQQIRY